LTDFSDHLLSASASCYFSNLLWLFILFHLFGDPKMGYNSDNKKKSFTSVSMNALLFSM